MSKLITITQLTQFSNTIKQYYSKLISELDNKITNFTIKDKTTSKTYKLEMDNGKLYIDDGEGED